MLVFRIEHKREFCQSWLYGKYGDSLTGHGPHSGGHEDCWKNPPNFGGTGRPPEIALMPHERCAVTIEQFIYWISGNVLRIDSQWHIVCYRVDDTKEGIDWRIDNRQVVFNPEFAIPLDRAITVEEIESLTGEKISA